MIVPIVEIEYFLFYDVYVARTPPIVRHVDVRFQFPRSNPRDQFVVERILTEKIIVDSNVLNSVETYDERWRSVVLLQTLRRQEILLIVSLDDVVPKRSRNESQYFRLTFDFKFDHVRSGIPFYRVTIDVHEFFHSPKRNESRFAFVLGENVVAHVENGVVTVDDERKLSVATKCVVDETERMSEIFVVLPNVGKSDFESSVNVSLDGIVVKEPVK